MERDEQEEDAHCVYSWRDRRVIIQLIIDGVEINRDNIVDYLKVKCRAVGNMIHKGGLRDSASMVREGK